MKQVFRGTYIEPPSANFPTITAIAETALIPTAFTKIHPDDCYAGATWKLTVGGTSTTGLAGTLIITPRFGLVIGGTAMVTSFAQNYVPSITLAPFQLEAWLQIRSVGVAAGANGNAVCWGNWTSLGAIATASSQTSHNFSSTGSVAVDTSVETGLWMGVTFSVAPSVIPVGALWEKVN